MTEIETQYTPNYIKILLWGHGKVSQFQQIEIIGQFLRHMREYLYYELHNWQNQT